MRQYAYYTARCILNLAIIKTLKINIFAYYCAMHMHICYFCYDAAARSILLESCNHALCKHAHLEDIAPNRSNNDFWS